VIHARVFCTILWKGGQVLYDNFLHILEKKGITPYKVAKETGISSSTLYDWKKGRYTPKFDKLKKIATYLGVTVEELTE
jgi:transcriptional regulator with XRE-family HTH domain